MPAIRRDLHIQAGSYEPEYWVFVNPDTGALLDLTAGYSVYGAVNSSSQGDGCELLFLEDSWFRRTTTGRAYFQPSSNETAGWAFNRGFYQFYVRHPLGQEVRFGEGRFFVSGQL